MKIDFISMPYAFTSDGQRIAVKEIEGSVRVGVSLEQVNGKYKVVGKTQDEDCVGGQCPIR